MTLRRSWPWFACGAVVLLALLLYGTSHEAATITVREPARTANEPADHPRLIGREETDAKAPAPQPSEGGRRFKFIDVATLAPVRVLKSDSSGTSGAPMEAEGWTTLPATTDLAGVMALEWALLTTEPMEVLKDEPPSSKVWVGRRVRVTVPVLLERPQLKGGDEPIRVVTGPSRMAGGDPLNPPATIGSPTWLGRLDRKHFPTIAESLESPVRFEQVALDGLAIVVGAPGHESGSQVLDLVAMGGSELEVHFSLKAGVSARIQVSDNVGRPIKRAHVQWYEDREGSGDAINPFIEHLIREERRTGLLMTSDRKTTRVAHFVGAKTRADGRVSVGPITSARRRYLVVWAPGYLPYLSVEDVAALASERAIRLEPLAPLRSSYRFTHEGEPITKGVLNLAEPLDGLTPALPSIDSQADGSFPSDLIVPGKEYFAVLRAGPQPHTGWVVFGENEVIDTSAFQQR